MNRFIGCTGLLLVWSVGCRNNGGSDGPSPETDPEPTDWSTSVGNPGNMTARAVPVPGLELRDGTWALSDLELLLCDGSRASAPVASGAIRLDGTSTIELPTLSEAQQAAGVCGITVHSDGALRIDGFEPEQNATFTLELALDAVQVDFTGPVDTTDARFDMALGGSEWLRIPWLGLVPDGHVTIREGHPQHDTLVGKLSQVVVTDETAGGAIGASEVEPVEPSLIVAVGKGGWISASYDGGFRWSEVRPAQDDASTDTLYAVASTESVTLAVGGLDVSTVVRTEDGSSFEEVPIDNGYGLRDVAWLGSEFLVVGREGRVARTPDGVEWNELVPLEDCHFEAIAQHGSDVMLVGEESGFGCVWLSTDNGATFTRQPDIEIAFRDVAAMDSGFVAIGDGGAVAWTLDAGLSWSTIVVEDPELFDVEFWDGEVKLLGTNGVYYTTNFFDIDVGETAGFRTLAPSLDQQVLLAVTDDGTVWEAPEDDAGTLEIWTERGVIESAASGLPMFDFVAWVR